MTDAATALAPVLVRLYAELSEAPRPVDRRTAKAAFEGACEAAHAVGLATTPTGVYMAVVDAFREHGARPVATAYNEERRAWSATVCQAVATGLANV